MPLVVLTLGGLLVIMAKGDIKRDKTSDLKLFSIHRQRNSEQNITLHMKTLIEPANDFFFFLDT